MSSVSGRPVRSTGVGLVFGEESSSEEEEAEDETASTGKYEEGRGGRER